MEHRHDRVDALNARDDLQFIADAWPDLLDRLGRESSRAADGMPKPASRSVGLVINDHVSELMREVGAWAVFLARALIDETDWKPPAGADTPALLEALAERIGHFTAHPDEMLAQAVIDEARAHRAAVTRAAYPDGIRTIHLGHIACTEPVMFGEVEVACVGHMTVRPRIDGSMPDMVCSARRDHRVPPARWRRDLARAVRHEDGARRLLEAMGGSAA